MKFLHNLLRAWRIATTELQYVEIYDLPGAWLDADAEWLAAQMRHPIGQKLKGRLANMVFRSSIQACQVETNGDYNRGIARGVLLAVHAIEQHFPAAPAASGASEEANDKGPFADTSHTE